MTNDDLRDLGNAKRLLENPGIAAKVADFIGTPVEKGIAMLPTNWQLAIKDATQEAIKRALDVAVSTMDGKNSIPSSDIFHKILVTITGGVGGAFGLPALAIELPISTIIMLRSIADIAQSHGEELENPEAKVACVEVFALGGRSKSDDASETGYFAVRAALARAVSEAASYIAERGIAKEGVPVLMRFITAVAERFGVAVSEKFVAQLVPIIGALGGATINCLFMDHFQDMARGHFTVRKLERKYGPETVKDEYDKFAV